MVGDLATGGKTAPTLAAGQSSSEAVKPFVAILADPKGTEAVDALVPYAILAESGAVEVRLVSATQELVHLTPGMAWAKPQATLAQLDRERRGPDVVIVPALTGIDDPVRADWLRAQARRGARLMSICNGGLVLAAAGLLDGRHATTHWYSVPSARRRHPNVSWRQDRRWVTDGPITTTAGISASEPASLDLLRRLAGEPTMRAVAARLKLPEPDPNHDGAAFRLSLRSATTVSLNRLAFWRREAVEIPIRTGFDELAFGVALDAWSRTYRSTAWATGAEQVTSRHGLIVSPSRDRPKRFGRAAELPTCDAMQTSFDAIGSAYGPSTARLVAWQFEHPFGEAGA